jgi:hypothetical protein
MNTRLQKAVYKRCSKFFLKFRSILGVNAEKNTTSLVTRLKGYLKAEFLLYIFQIIFE